MKKIQKITIMKNLSHNFLVLILVISVSNICKAQDIKTVSHDFNNGDLAPFEACTVKSPNYARVEDGRVKTFWTSTGYDGTRTDKGAEFCGHELGDWLTYKEGWCGVNMELGSDYPKDKNAGIAQIMGRFLDREWSTWSGEISIHNGDLKVSHRYGAGSSNTVDAIIYPDFPYEEEVSIIIHFILSSQNQGELEFWINGVSSYKATNINFGLGEFENDEQVPGLSRTIFKLGQYNYDDSNYDIDETRTVYYDNVTWYSGANGYDIVNPDKTSNPCGNILINNPVNAENYCGSQGVEVKAASEGGSYIGGIQHGDYLNYGPFNFDKNTVNAFEVAVGKSSTKDTFVEVRLDSPTGTLVGTLNTSETTGGSQNWITRWAALEAVSGEHDIFLVFTGQEGVTLVNFNWFRFFFDSSLSLNENKASLMSMYPNPTDDYFTIINSQGATVQINDINGRLMLRNKIDSNKQLIDISNFNSGVYFVKVNNSGIILYKKIVKK